MMIYFVGIGGTGISPLAGLAIDCNMDIAGSDVGESLGTKEIAKRGVKINYLQDGEYLEVLHKKTRIDWLVHTAAVELDHLELRKAKELGIRVTKRDEFLNFILREKNLKLVAVAGTHGKTTTTSMIVWAMKQLKIPVSYLIGSQISFGQSSQHQKGSEYFILEADEFDRNFLKYDPAISLITNVDYDHPDVYFDQGEYNQAFADFLAKTKQLTCIYKPDYTKIDSLNKFQNIDVIDQKSEEYTRISKKIKLIGKHNRDNAFLAVKAMKKICRISEEEIIKSMSTFLAQKEEWRKL